MNIHSIKDVLDKQVIAIYWDKLTVDQQVSCKVDYIDYNESLIIYKSFTFKPWFFRKRTIIVRAATILLPHSNKYIQVYFDADIPMKYGDSLTISTPFQKQYTKIVQPEKEIQNVKYNHRSLR